MNTTTTNRKLDIQGALETIQIIVDALGSSDYTKVLTTNKYRDINTNITNAKDFIKRIRLSKLNGSNEGAYRQTLEHAKNIYTHLVNNKERLDKDIGKFPLDLKTVSGPSGLFGNSTVNASEALLGGRRRHRTRKAKKAKKTRKMHKCSRK
jgi:hypothetical protein